MGKQQQPEENDRQMTDQEAEDQEEYESADDQDEGLHEAWEEVKSRAKLVDDVEDQLVDKDKEVASLQNKVQSLIYHNKQQATTYEMQLRREAKKIRYLEEQVNLQSNTPVAARTASATPATLESIMEEMRKLKLENACLKSTMEKNSDYDESPEQKKRKRYDKTPK